MALTARRRSLLRAIAGRSRPSPSPTASHSTHTSGFTSLGDAGVLLVREPERLRDAFSLVPAYLRVDHDPDGVSDAPWLAEYGPEQTRPYRALRVWAAMKASGRDGYRRLIEHDLDLADYLARLASENESLELDSLGLSVVCFHCVGVATRFSQRSRDESSLAARHS